MTAVYIKLVIANALGNGGRAIDSVPAKHIVDVAVGVIVAGIEDGADYITIEDVPEKYRAAVREKLEEQGFEI